MITYQLTFRGEAGPVLDTAFEEFALTRTGGTTVLRCQLSDDAALQGVIARVFSLGLELIDLHQVGDPGASDGVCWPTTVELPAGLAWIADQRGGATWLAGLPALVARAERRWGLTVGPPFVGSHLALVLPATTSVGAEVVVKLRFPGDREGEHEAAALRCWAGTGAIALLDEDAGLGALLLERCDPGTALTDLAAIDPAAALDVVADLLPTLWVVPPPDAPFVDLDDEAGRWHTHLRSRWAQAGRPYPEALLDAAAAALEELLGGPSERLLLHQDLHGANVLAATRAGRSTWLAIDPKPVVGERAFALAPVIRSAELGHSRAQVVDRLDVLSGRLGVDRERARRWALAQTLAWAVGPDGTHLALVEVAGWLAAA